MTLTSMDLAGFTQHDAGVWTDEQGQVLSLHSFDLVPDLPAALDDLDTLRAELAISTAAAGAGLIEAGPETVDGVPAVRQIVKVPHPQGHGLVFVGSVIVPKASCSIVIKVQAAESGTTGAREATVLAEVGPTEYFQPHPYAAAVHGGLPYHVGDLAEWDEKFPDHPLTTVRRTLDRLVPTAALGEDFKALPSFVPTTNPGEGADSDQPARRGLFRRRGGK
ncbi:hypothetical protein ABT160_09200 [Streptomyces sp. NPDC001941]|uniref:hypothetical protein n=1 Tax=Streptomyces sp. NPDC001941 TaxID=3154659 RepID=UPI003319DD2A